VFSYEKAHQLVLIVEYLFSASLTTVYEKSLSCFHPILQDGEVIPDKNEKIGGCVSFFDTPLEKEGVSKMKRTPLNCNRY
jgi:hypothetical protein